MAQNIIKHSWKRNKSFLIVNIAGLVIGLTVATLLFLFAYNELSYDCWYKNSDNIVRLNSIMVTEGNRQYYPLTNRKAYTELKTKVAGVKSAVQLFYQWNTSEVISGTNHFQEIKTTYSEPELFEVFGFKLLEGDPNTALVGRSNVVISNELSKKIFGDKSPIGEPIKIGGHDFVVNGVLEDFPENTHMHFDIYISMTDFGIDDSNYRWTLESINFFTYFLLDENADRKSTIENLESEYNKLLVQFFESMGTFDVDCEAMPVKDIYMNSKSNFELGNVGNKKTVIILIIIAILVLMLAITNFTNLFLVQGKNRSTEIGVRKVNGASRTDIANLFFAESFFVVFLATIMAIVISYFLLPIFSDMLDKTIESTLLYSPLFISIMLLIVIAASMLSGIYPAFILSKSKPIDIMKKSGSSPSKRTFSHIVVIFQSIITIVLISFLLLINKQTRHLHSIPLNCNIKNVMLYLDNNTIYGKYDAYRNDLMNLPQVVQVCRTGNTIGDVFSVEGFYEYGDVPENSKVINNYNISSRMDDVLGFELVEGSFFKEDDNGTLNNVVVNEQAAKKAGLTLGKQIVFHGNTTEVIGIVKDFIYDAPGKPIEPIILNNFNGDNGKVNIKFEESLTHKQCADLIKPVLNKYDSEFVLSHIWLEDVYDKKLKTEDTLSTAIFIGSLLAVIIAIMGLVAVHSFTITGRIKEIGVRKVSGSSTTQIILLLSKNVLIQTLIAGIISVPLAMFIGNKWLMSYSDKVSIDLMIIILPILIQLLIAFCVTFFVSYNTANENPVKALKYE